MKNENFKIISIETSGKTCAVSLSVGNAIIGNYSVYGNNLHDKLNAEFVRRILDDNTLSINNINAVAVSGGPGSFTGLRIGVSIAKALCFKENLNSEAPEFIAVPTLSALAFNVIEIAILLKAQEIISLIPAFKDLIYIQQFDLSANPLSEIELLDKDTINQKIKHTSLLCGPGAKEFNDAITYEAIQELSATTISKLAIKMYKESLFTNPNEFTPLYNQEFKPRGF